MLHTAADFPHPGSFALLVDDTLPLSRQRAELVRLLEVREQMVLVAFPLRDGAGGNRRVAMAEVMDATPLSKAEEREMHDLERALKGQPRTRSRKEKRHHQLRNRLILSELMKAERAKLALRDGGQQPSRGRLLPRELAA